MSEYFYPVGVGDGDGYGSGYGNEYIKGYGTGNGDWFAINATYLLKISELSNFHSIKPYFPT